MTDIKLPTGVATTTSVTKSHPSIVDQVQPTKSSSMKVGHNQPVDKQGQIYFSRLDCVIIVATLKWLGCQYHVVCLLITGTCRVVNFMFCCLLTGCLKPLIVAIYDALVNYNIKTHKNSAVTYNYVINWPDCYRNY